MDTDIDRLKDLLQEFDLYNYGILLVSVCKTTVFASDAGAEVRRSGSQERKMDAT